MVNFTVSVGGGSRWPDGKPVKSEMLADGKVKHFMADGRVLTGSTLAQYRLEYQSSWVGAEPGETYPVNVTLVGLSAVPGFVEVWNHDIDQVRNYAFHKIGQLVDLAQGWEVTGAELCAQLGGEMLKSD